MHSCLYRGTVFHRRQTPVSHQFAYRLYWLYLDLQEWPEVRRRVRGLSDRLFAPASFYRPDHLGDPQQSMLDAVRAWVRSATGVDLACGPIRLLTQPRSLGFYFSPLNLYFCFHPDETLAAVVAEVNNTPWGEQHCYLLWDGNRLNDESTELTKAKASLTEPPHQFVHGKEFHVSPFMQMDQQYHWQLSVPGEELQVHLGTTRCGERLFDAGMQLQRQPLTSATLAGNLLRSPVNAARVLFSIYFQAFRLWRKRCPYFPHPRSTSSAVT